MLKEKVGMVTETEKNQILELHERSLGLKELLIMLDNTQLSMENKDELYEKAIVDMGNSKRRMQTWWDNMSKKYQWKSIKEGQWSIDFNSNEIFLL